MSTDAESNDVTEPQVTIVLTKEGELWVAKDEATGVASQGSTRTEALEMLDEAIALHARSDDGTIETAAEERAVLEELGIDPDEIEAARDETDELPDFMK